MPLITLYILNHNYGRFLKQAIASALNQTFQDFEIVIIDDGSTENSRDIIEDYRDNNKISIILQENKEQTVSANVALNNARRKYLIRFDADDWLIPEALEILYKSISDKPKVAYVFSGYYLTDASGYIKQEVRRSYLPYYLKADDSERHGACCLIYIKKLKAVGGYNTLQDCKDELDIFLKFRNRFQIMDIPNFLFYYRRHENNLTNDIEKTGKARKEILKQFI